MKLDHLRHFIAAAERGSLRAAARQLGVAQPAISRSIREMERELGVPLFERHRQGARLTPMGEIFLRRAVSVRSELRRAQEEIDQLAGQMTGEASVAMTAVSSFTLLPKALAGLRLRYPEAVVKITTAFFQTVEPQLLNGEMDFYVGPLRDRVSQTKYVTEKLFDHRWVVIARRGHALSGRRRLSELLEADWVKPSLAARSNEADISEPFERLGLPLPRIVLHTTSATTTLLAVASSDLLTIVPKQLLNAPISENLFDIIDLEQPLEGAPIRLVRRRDLPLTPLAEYFSDMVRRAAAAQAQQS